MSKIDSQLLYAAYKEMIFKNLDTGLFFQHAEEANYLYLRQDEKLFSQCIDLCNKKYNVNKFLEGFFNVNPDLRDDPVFLRKLMPQLDSVSANSIYSNNLPIQIFDGDTQMMFVIIKNLGSNLYQYYRGLLPKSRVDEKLRDMLFEDGCFKFSYFDLPYKKDPEFIKNALNQDPSGYLLLDEEDLKNKDFLLAVLNSKFIKTNYASYYLTDISEIYNKIPDELKEDREIIKKLLDVGFAKQKSEVFWKNPDIFYDLLSKKDFVDGFKNLENKLNLEVFSNNACLREFFNVVLKSNYDDRDQKRYFPDYKKLLTSIRKYNKFFAKQVKSNEIKDFSASEAYLSGPTKWNKYLSALIMNEILEQRNEEAGVDNKSKASKMKI